MENEIKKTIEALTIASRDRSKPPSDIMHLSQAVQNFANALETIGNCNQNE